MKAQKQNTDRAQDEGRGEHMEERQKHKKLLKASKSTFLLLER